MADTPAYVADTHGLIWFLYASPKLGKGALSAFEAVGRGEARLVVPAIVIAELVYIAERGKAAVDVDWVIGKLSANPAIEIAPLSVECILAMRSLKAIPEMHDRLIATEAHRRGAKVITRDPMIRDAKVVETVW